MRLTRAGARNRWLSVLAVLSFAIVWTSGARAQTYTDPATVRWTCGTGTTCTAFSSGGVNTIITTNSSPTLAFSETGSTTYSGEAFMVVLVPSSESSGLNFTVSEGSTSLTVNNLGNWTGSTYSNLLSANNGKSPGFLGVTAGGATPMGGFSPFSAISNDFLPSGSSVTSTNGYTVYVVDLGAYSGSAIDFSFGGDGLPAGTVLWGFVANSGCKVSSFSSCTGADGMPYSETVTIVPEPATLGLVGCGLLLLGFAVRRRQLV